MSFSACLSRKTSTDNVMNHAQRHRARRKLHVKTCAGAVELQKAVQRQERHRKTRNRNITARASVVVPGPGPGPRSGTNGDEGQKFGVGSLSRLNTNKTQKEDEYAQLMKKDGNHSCFLDSAGLWKEIRDEALKLSRDEPRLASSLFASILGHSSLCSCLSFLLSNKLSSTTLLPVHLQSLIEEVFNDHVEVARACQLDIEAVYDRDPACFLYSQCLLFYKGFQAVQAQRVAHCLWKDGRKSLATLLQSRISDVFHVDIHPGARLG